MRIGQRAAKAIRQRVNYGRVRPELDRLGIPQPIFCNWEVGKFDPSAYYFQILAEAGYDIYWIATGRIKYPAPNVDFDIAEYEEEE